MQRPHAEEVVPKLVAAFVVGLPGLKAREFAGAGVGVALIEPCATLTAGPQVALVALAVLVVLAELQVASVDRQPQREKWPPAAV